MAESPDTRLLSETNGRSMFIPRGEGYTSVRSHGAKRDNVTDDLDAFTAAQDAAIAAGHRRVYAPGGLGPYRVRSAILLKDGVELYGDGIDNTIIKLSETAPRGTWVVTNAQWSIGNKDIRVRSMTLDWNRARQGGLTAEGGARSSCLTWGNTKNCRVENVKAVGAALHGFDVTWAELNYPYLGDGNTAPANKRASGNKFIDCEASDFGDDAFTCHSSNGTEWISSFGHSPWARTNCNAFEVDGDSYDTVLTGNRSEGCYAGIEIKGHGTESAARVTTINGHKDEGSARSYNFRHIGYHSSTDPLSLTAKNIIATNLVSINPNNDKGFQDEASPRALCISAYRGVSITGFTAVGRGGYVTADVAVAIQFKSADINITGINISGWTGAGRDISITTGTNVNLTGITCRGSAGTAVYTGDGVKANIQGVTATAPATGAVYGIDVYSTKDITVGGVTASGYPIPVRADLTDFLTVDSFLRRTGVFPPSVTRLADLDPTKDYYATTDVFAALTDIPTGQLGGNFITHSRVNADSTVQTVVRNTSTSGQQTAWRVLNFVTKTAGPWNRPTVTQV